MDCEIFSSVAGVRHRELARKRDLHMKRGDVLYCATLFAVRCSGCEGHGHAPRGRFTRDMVRPATSRSGDIHVGVVLLDLHRQRGFTDLAAWSGAATR